MPPWLYLDTARLGQMSPAAQLAQQDFIRLAGEVGGAIQMLDLLHGGHEALGDRFGRKFPGLRVWHGITALKQSLCRLGGFPADSPTHFASRSAELMALAARLLCRTCKHILSTDLAWPPYQDLLSQQCRRSSRRLTIVPMAECALGRMTEREMVETIRGVYEREQCDGLFLSGISSRGVRTPVGLLNETLRDQARFVVLDGAQDFCHLPANASRHCDFYLASCHKWLGGYLPLGVAVCPRLRWRKTIARILSQTLEGTKCRDPLLRVLEHVKGSVEETVNLAPLFSAAGAAFDAAGEMEMSFASRISNTARIAELANDAGWFVYESSRPMGILCAKRRTTSSRLENPEELRRAFDRHGIILSSYQDGQVRISAPSAPLGASHFERLRSAFAQLV